MKPVIETHALCKSYHGRPVVDHLNLTVPEGCVYGFLGPNGAGKSTTMKMLLGRANAEEGKPGGEILPGYGPLLGLELLTEWHGKANQRG